MSRLRLSLPAALLAGLLLAPLLVAAPPVDDAHGPLLRAFPTGLRWDNLERLPAWCGKATLKRRKGLQVLRLEEGQTLHVPIPARAWLRVHPHSAAMRSRLRVQATDGSGLLVTLPDRSVPGHPDALFGPMDDRAAILRLICPRDGKGALELSLFNSRLESARPLPPYRHPIETGGIAHRLGRAGDLQTERWEAFQPGQRAQAWVEGPARVALEARLRAGQEQMRDGLQFQLRWSLDAAPPADHLIRTAVDLGEPLLLDGRPQRVGRSERLFLDVPQGRHELTVSADHAVLLRLHGEGPRNTLLEGLNLPRPWLPGVVPALENGDTRRLEAAEGLAKDARFQSPGLTGLAALDPLIRAQPDHLPLHAVRERLAHEWTTFRSLLPTELPPGRLTPAYAWLRGPAENPDIPVQQAGSPADLEQALTALPQALFHGLSRPVVFDLEPRTAPSELRLLLDATDSHPGTRLLLQFDQQPPVAVDLERPLALPPEWRSVGPQDLALALAAQDRRWKSQPLLQGSERAPLMPPLRLLEASSARFPLPPGVRQVRLWCATPAPERLRVALQLRVSRATQAPARGPELSDAAAIQGWLARAGSERPEARPWLPLQRWLAVHAASFRASVVIDARMAETLKGVPTSGAAEAALRARKLEAEGQSLATVEAWARAFRSATGPARTEALEGLVRSLFRAGEPVLAEQWLKAAFLHGDPTLQEWALPALTAHYLSTQEDSSRLGLLATAAAILPTPVRLKQLAAAGLEEGQAEQALRILSLLPPSLAPELWLRAGRAIRSQEALTLGLQASGDTEIRWLWEGILSFDLGLEAQGLAAWDRSGTTGAPWREARQEALTLATRLTRQPTDPDANRRWAAWSGQHPGPWSWRPEPWLVTTAAGGAQLHALDLHVTQTAFRSSSKAPVQLKVVGPLRLRLEAYPLHAAGSKVPLEGWLEIKGAGWHRAVPFRENWPSPGLQLDGHPDLRPGQRVSCELDLPAGVHELTVGLGPLAALILPSSFRPEVPLGPLPLRTAEAWSALGASEVHPKLTPSPGWSSGIFLARESRFALLRPEALRSAVLAPLPGAPALPAGALPPGARPAGESLQDLLAALDPPADAPVATAARLDALAHAAEAHPTQRAACLAQAERLALACPKAVLISRGLALLREGAVWTQAGMTGTGAGIRTVPRTAWKAEGPSARIRLALLAHPGDFLLSGRNAVVYQFQRKQAETIRLELSPFDPGLGRPVPTVIVGTLDGQPLRKEWLPGAEPLVWTFPLSAGAHTLRLQLDTPFEGQWARLRFLGGLGEGALELPDQRFEVARRGRPVRFIAEGPVWVRIDRWRPEGEEPEYRYLPPGPQQIQIEPGPNETEVLCALRLQEILPDSLRPQPRPYELPVHPVPASSITPSLPQDNRLQLADAFPLGGQEDGTHMIRVRAFHRRDPDSVASQGGNQRGQEAAFQHAFLTPAADQFQQWGGWVRSLTDSGTSAALEGALDQASSLRPLIWFGRGSLTAQRGAGTGRSQASAESLAIEGGLRMPLELGRNTWHEPQIAVFWRGFHLAGMSHQGLANLDLDLWSPYKARNPNGLKVSESFHHRPWDDTLWSAQGSASITRPEGASPVLSLVNLAGGWRQRLGSVESLLEGGVSRYAATALNSGPTTRSHLRLGLEGRVWTFRQNLLLASTEVRFDLSPRTWSGWVALSWTFGNGRGQYELRRRATAFPDFDARTLSRQANNSLREVSP